MDKTLRIGIIGGKGWIGGGLARALVAAGLPAGNLHLSCRGAPPDWLPGAHWTTDNRQLAGAVDVVVISVRPQDWPAIDIDATGKLVVSVMAAIPAADIAARTGADRIVRALPNAAVDLGLSYTPWTATDAVTDQDRVVVRGILESCGTEDEVGGEDQIDYLSGFSGTGPAYPALLAAAMMQDAIARGLPEAVARRAAAGTLIGAGRILEQTGEDPADTVETFLDYRGVTAAGIQAMRAAGFDRAVSAGLQAALEKARAMGRQDRSAAVDGG